MRIHTGFGNAEKDGVYQFQQIVNQETKEASSLLNGEQTHVVEGILVLLKALHNGAQPLGDNFATDTQTLLPSYVTLAADA